VPKGSVTATSATASAASDTGLHAKTGALVALVQGAASSAVSDQGARQTRSKRPEEDTADTEVGVVVASAKGAVKVFLVSPKALAAAAGERESLFGLFSVSLRVLSSCCGWVWCGWLDVRCEMLL
jgi:hypothetical protein